MLQIELTNSIYFSYFSCTYDLDTKSVNRGSNRQSRVTLKCIIVTMFMPTFRVILERTLCC